MGTAFADTAPLLVARGYSPLPIAPGTKAPGTYWLRDGWWPMRHWDDWCKKFPLPNVIQGWSKWPDAGVGVACGMGLICIDIDMEGDCMTALLAMLPPSNVQKKGRKGVSLFYRGNTDKIRSRNFRTPEKVGLVDLLSEGKQTVLPPSVHPDTGEPYYWLTEATLENTRANDLTELPDDIAEQIGEVLKEFGYDPVAERQCGANINRTNAPTCASAGGSATSLYREVNDLALANLAAWVPKLGLQRCYRSGGGFKAVAEWRSSGSGRPLARRNPNLSFASQGIRDFGDGLSYSPIDVVMAAHRVSASEALDWLGALVSQSWREPLVVLTSRKKT